MTYQDPVDPTQMLPIVSPTNMMPVQVIKRETVAPHVVTLHIVLPGTRQAPAPYVPGQFITLALPTTRETLYRSYSLCSAGDPDHPWEVTIKRLHQGAVSTYMYDAVRENTLLYASFPRGSFTLPRRWSIRTPFIFVAAGSGITPIIGMLRYLAQLSEDERPRAQLHYASRTVEDIIYRDELDEMDIDESWLRQWHYVSSQNNRMNAEIILSHARADAPYAHWYMCGPASLKQDLQTLLADYGVPEEQIHAEVFATELRVGKAQIGEVFTTGKPVGQAASGAKVRVVETGDVLDLRERETLLVALERHGYKPDFSCRAGACGACRLKLLAGQVAPTGEALSANERAAGYVLSCVAIPQGDVTLASGGQPPANRIGAAAGHMGASDTRQMPRALVRMVSLVAAGGLAFGMWTLTNHKHASWYTHAAAAPSSGVPTATPPPRGRPQPGKTPTTAPAGGGLPTATPSGSGGVSPAPTATPQPPPPSPVATATPSVRP